MRRTHLTHRSGAQAMVEFALAITAFTFLLLAVFDWGRVLVTYATLVNATREGARRAMVVDSTSANNTVTAASLRPTIQTALDNYVLPLGPGLRGLNPDVCLFDPGTTLSVTAANPCDPAVNGGVWPATTPESRGRGAILAIRTTYTFYFVPLMSVILPNGLALSTSTVSYLE